MFVFLHNTRRIKVETKKSLTKNVPRRDKLINHQYLTLSYRFLSTVYHKILLL